MFNTIILLRNPTDHTICDGHGPISILVLIGHTISDEYDTIRILELSGNTISDGHDTIIILAFRGHTSYYQYLGVDTELDK